MRHFFILLIISCAVLTACSNQEITSIDKEPTKTVKQESNEETNGDTKDQKPENVYNLGEDYTILDTPYPTNNEKHVVVYEFFGYTCPHCFHFEPFLNSYIADKPDYVELQRVPLNFQPGWAIYQQAYLTAEVMGIINETHIKLFKALHEDHKRFKSIDELATWYASETGIDERAFISTADSFILDSKQRKADKMGFLMKITSTPSIVVNGKYVVAKTIRDRNEIFNIVRYLVSKEAKAMELTK